MLLHDQLHALQAVRDDPAVTVLWTLPPAGAPAPLDDLLDEVAERLRLEVDDDEVEQRLEDLRGLAAGVAEDRGQRAVALFASRTFRAASRLPEPVRDRVVVDETFATRDLVRAVHRTPEYLVLVLAEPVTRLYEGRGRILAEVTTGEFPLSTEAPEERGRHRRHDTGSERDRHLDDVARAIDRGLSRSELDGRPLVVVGGRERSAKYCARSRHQARIIGTALFGRADQPAVAQIRDVAWPVIEEWLAAQTSLALLELDRAAGSKRLAAGIGEVCPRARR